MSSQPDALGFRLGKVRRCTTQCAISVRYHTHDVQRRLARLAGLQDPDRECHACGVQLAAGTRSGAPPWAVRWTQGRAAALRREGTAGRNAMTRIAIAA